MYEITRHGYDVRVTAAGIQYSAILDGEGKKSIRLRYTVRDEGCLVCVNIFF